ncbi:MAG: hypothetical protein HKP43_09440 [Altererythrobacter sp.]|nr:hypothetical protein [Altererythrobacter sp.]NNK46828.1 hypothetical protein [Altererythrobacter sp.]
MMEEKTPLKFWLLGLGILGTLLVTGMLAGDASQYNIVDHQAAGTAEMVNTIQADWRANGLSNAVIYGMIADFVFIAIYSWGSFVAGRSLYRSGNTLVRLLGGVVVAAAIVFLISDYLETILQLIQMLRDEGVDWMAATAATAQPIKFAAFYVTFFGVIAALIVRLVTRPKT